MKDDKKETRDKIRKALTAVYYEKEKGKWGSIGNQESWAKSRPLGL